MKTYSSYNDTGIIWLGKIPSSWRIKSIKHNTYVKGRIGWQGLNSDEYGDVGAYLVTGTDFDKGRINWNTCHHISEERYAEDPYIQLQDKDLLITKDGTIGKIALVDKLPDKATLNSGVFVARPKTDDYITPFIYWVLNSTVFNVFIDYTKTGSTIQHLYQQTFVEFSYPVPSLPEQQAIADFLDRKTSQIDTLIEKKQRQIELLQEQRAALINHVVTKGLNPNVKMKDSGVEWLGEIPSHWDMVRLRHISPTISVGLVIQPTQYVDEDGTVPFLYGSNIRENSFLLDNVRKISPESSQKLNTSMLHAGDLVTVRVGYPGVTAVIPPFLEGANCASMMIVRKSDFVLSEYLCCTMNSRVGMLQVGAVQYGAAQKQFNISHAVDFIYPIPPLEEQKIIVDYLEGKSQGIYRLISIIQKQIEMLQEYRTALISEAVTGKINVRAAV
jgi:type I restriction enzyme, S subunit